jgi:hypothetical protein
VAVERMHHQVQQLTRPRPGSPGSPSCRTCVGSLRSVGGRGRSGEMEAVHGSFEGPATRPAAHPSNRPRERGAAVRRQSAARCPPYAHPQDTPSTRSTPDQRRPSTHILATRWSAARRFLMPARNCSAGEQATALLEAARWSPSCYGDQAVAPGGRRRSCRPGGPGRRRSYSPGALQCRSRAPTRRCWRLARADPRFGHNGADDRSAPSGAGAAALALCLQANAMGMSTHQMGALRRGQDARGLQASRPRRRSWPRSPSSCLGSDAVLDDAAAAARAFGARPQGPRRDLHA